MWVKLDDHFVDHPKLLAVGPLAGWLFVAGLCYANRLLTDGFIPENQVGRLLPNGGGNDSQRGTTTKLVDQLCAVGLWKPATMKSTKGFRIHDFLKYQPSRKQVLHDRHNTAKRQAKWRHNNHGKGDALVTDT